MKKRWIVYSVVAVLIGFVLINTYGDDDSIPSFESAVVERGTVSHVVSVTGHIEPVSRVKLAFPSGGRIAWLPATEGLVVEKGAVLAGLDADAIQSMLGETQAQVARQRALLAELLAPLRNEERAVKDATVSAAERTLATSKESAYVAVSRAFVYADDAIHEEADELFEQTQGGSPTFGIDFTYGTTRYTLQADRETEISLNQQRRSIEDILEQMEERARERTLSAYEALIRTEYELAQIEHFLSELAAAVNRYSSDDTLEQVVYESFQTSVATARTSVYTARADITASIKEYETADAALTTASRALDLSLAGASNGAVVSQEAAVAASLAAVSTAREHVRDTLLTAPISGTVSRVEHEIGETVAPFEPVVELLTEGAFEIEALIPEADIAKVKLGDAATVTFDAFDNTLVFKAEIVRIALSETFREGVPTYKTTLVLLEKPSEELIIRPGMTVDADILTDAREDVLFVPVRSVIHEGGRTFVRIFNGAEFDERTIQTGLRGSAGTVEVTGGLNEDDEIVLFIDE